MIEIVICTDENYVMPSGVLMTSILMNSKTPDEVRFHLISEDKLSVAAQTALNRIVSRFKSTVLYYNFSLSAQNMPFGLAQQSDHISVMSYMRLFIVEVLPDTIDKVIYLDCDVICRHDLSDLWHEAIDGFAIGCCKEGSEDFSQYNTIRLEFELGYCNTGVLLINLAYWRKHHVLEKCLKYASEYPERCVWFDQDILNAVLRREKKILHRKYNVTSSLFGENRQLLWTDLEEASMAAEDPVLVHFTGSLKPWHKPFDIHPFSHEYKYYQSQTEWAGVVINRKNNKRMSDFEKVLRRIKRRLSTVIKN